MDERRDDQVEDLAKELDNIEVTELDDKDLEGAAGGQAEEEAAGDNNFNCGCNGKSGTGGSGNTNCGC